MAASVRDFGSPEKLQKQCDEFFALLSKEEDARDRIPTVSGLCLHLHCTYNTLQSYARVPGYEDVIAEAYMRIENWFEKEIASRTTGTNGLQAVLENRFQWTKKREFEMGEKTREAATMQLPMSEKLLLMKKAHAELFTAQSTAVKIQEAAKKNVEARLLAMSVTGQLVNEEDTDEQSE